MDRDFLLVLISTPIYIIVIGLELILSSFKKIKAYTWRDTIENIYLMLLNMGLDVLFRLITLYILTFFYHHRLANAPENVYAYWILLFLFEDFMYYWLHRIDHYCRFFWAVHVTHHSSEQFNFTVGFRSSVFQPLYRFLYFVPIAWMGFMPLDILFIYSATQIWGILVHTRLIGNLGILEHILVTPSHHRVHHASNAIYLDRNMGMALIIWDKMFGTFQKELPEPEITYGLTKNLDSHHPLHVVFHEWKNIIKDVKKYKSWKHKFMAVFGPPGWSPDGSSKTSKELRREFLNEHPSLS
jgi:sterol desaturase/sphingolipid hydroxylase (fatty acid hydroxylase superfamily)